MDDDPSHRFASGQALVNALTAAVSGASTHHEVEPLEPEPGSESPSVPAAIQIVGLVPGAAAFADEGDDDELEAEVTAATQDEAPRPGPTLAFGSHLPAAEDGGASSPAEAPLPSRTPLTLTGRETAREREIPPSTPEPEEQEHEEIEAAPVEDVTRWELTHQEAEPAGATAERDAGRYEDVEVEAAADALVFDAAESALTGDAGPASHAEPPRARGLEHIEDSRAGMSAASPLPETARRGAAAFEEPSIAATRRDPPRAARADERVPFQSFSATPERERTSILPVAMGLVIGLLLGFGGGYFVGQRGPRLATMADATGAAAPSAEPPARPAGTLGTARADTDRPVPALAPGRRLHRQRRRRSASVLRRLPQRRAGWWFDRRRPARR